MCALLTVTEYISLLFFFLDVIISADGKTE